MKKIILLSLIVAMITISCSKNDNEADAWGNFEVREVMISAQGNGQIIDFPANEGDKVQEGDIIAVIDTSVLDLKLNELRASMKAVSTKIAVINSQNGIFKQQISNAKVDLERVHKMLQDGAATQKQLDDISGKIAVLEKQIEANNSQKSSVSSELNVLESKVLQIEDQKLRSVIEAPLSGTVLSKYAEKGEITTAGKPLVKIANLDLVRLKVYVSGGQLSQVKIGNNCKVRIDKGKEDYYEYDGNIIIISDKAEFTPKIIQTKEERVSMVYAVTINVKNDGKIKSGMPGEAIFSHEQ